MPSARPVNPWRGRVGGPLLCVPKLAGRLEGRFEDLCAARRVVRRATSVPTIGAISQVWPYDGLRGGRASWTNRVSLHLPRMVVPKNRGEIQMRFTRVIRARHGASLLGLLLSAVLAACGGGAPSQADHVPLRTAAQRAAPAGADGILRNMRAAHMGGNWENNVFGIKSAAATATFLDYLQSQHVNWLGISVAIFLDSGSDPTVRVHYRPDGDLSGQPFVAYTFDDDDLLALIAAARARGIHVYLTLAFEHVSSPAAACGGSDYLAPRSTWGYPSLATVDPSNQCGQPSAWWWSPDHPQHAEKVAAFWASYTQVAVRYAALAQAAGVEMFSLGTETEGLFRTRAASPWSNHFGTQLAGLVASVRAVYGGLLTYDQHYDVLVATGFYSGQGWLFGDLALDVVGVSAYFPLADTARPYSVEELEASWRTVFSRSILPLRDRNPGRPVVFLEFGYTDDVGSVVRPSAGEFEPQVTTPDGSETPGMTQQKNILGAFFNVNQAMGEPVRGAFLWDNQYVTPAAQLCGHKGFGQFCKPAATVVAARYAELENRDVERVFGWAEQAYPQFFPSSQLTGSALGYRFRHYPESHIYLGAKDGRVVVHNGANWNFLDVGSFADFLSLAAAGGF